MRIQNVVMFQIVILISPLVSHAGGMNAGLQIEDMIVGEVRQAPRCSSCYEGPLVCAARAEGEIKKKVVALNKRSGVMTIFEGETFSYGSHNIRCGIDKVENITFYIDYGCSAGESFKRFRRILAIDEINGTNVTALVTQELELECKKQGRELYFSGLSGIPQTVKRLDEVKFVKF